MDVALSCPLCGSDAMSHSALTAKWKDYSCASCVAFRATDEALHRLSMDTPEVRIALSHKARSTPENSILFLSHEHMRLHTQETVNVYSEYVVE